MTGKVLSQYELELHLRGPDDAVTVGGVSGAGAATLVPDTSPRSNPSTSSTTVPTIAPSFGSYLPPRAVHSHAESGGSATAALANRGGLRTSRPVVRAGAPVGAHTRDDSPQAGFFRRFPHLGPPGSRFAAEDGVLVDGRALLSAGNWNLKMGRLDDAVRSFRMAAEHAEAAGDLHLRMQALASVVQTLQATGSYGEAVEVANEVIALWEDAGTPLQLALSLNTLARLHLELIDGCSWDGESHSEWHMHCEAAGTASDRARELLEGLLASMPPEANMAQVREDLGSVMHTLTKVCIASYDYESAVHTARQAKALFEETGDQWGAAGASFSAAQAHYELWQMHEAAMDAEWAEENYRLSGNLNGAESARQLLANIKNQLLATGGASLDEAAHLGNQQAGTLDYSRFDQINDSSDDEGRASVESEATSWRRRVGAEAAAALELEQEVASSEPLGTAPRVAARLKEVPGLTEAHAAPVQTSSSQEKVVRVSFLYASPLMAQARPLDVAADLQALRSAQGVQPEVRVATAGRLREVLFARPAPGILHISAHCMPGACGEVLLVLEDDSSAAHCLGAADIAATGPWDSVELLVFLSCSSEGFARDLMRHSGLRRAVCCSVAVLDRAAHLFAATLYQALGGGRALLSSHEIARAAIRGSPDERISCLADQFVLLGEPAPPPAGLWAPLAVQVPAPGELAPRWPLWPRVEDFVGRQSLTISLVRFFEQRRIVCLLGERGLGKTALCHEFCRQYSAPGGRRFSEGAFLVDYYSALRGVNGDHPDAFACAILEELHVRAPQHCGDAASGLAAGTVRQALRSAVRQLDQAGPWLLVVDGLPRSGTLRSGSRSPSSSCFSSGPSDDEDVENHSPRTPLDFLHGVLEELLCISARLCLLLTARQPLRGRWAAIGLSKVVEIDLPLLSPKDSARLFARRAARPLYRRDFGLQCESDWASPLPFTEELLEMIASSPLGPQMGGNPGRILAAAAEVHAGLPSLLRHPWLLPAAV